MAVCPGARQSYEQASGPRLPGVAAQGGDFHIGAALEHMMWEGLEQIGQFHAKTPFLMGRRSGDASPGGGGPLQSDAPGCARGCGQTAIYPMLCKYRPMGTDSTLFAGNRQPPARLTRNTPWTWLSLLMTLASSLLSLTDSTR